MNGLRYKKIRSIFQRLAPELNRRLHKIAHPDRPAWPRITVVTPVLNAQETIEETICSVLDQCYPNLQYIVQDGGSTDGTLEILQKYQGRLIIQTEKDEGMYDALHKAFHDIDGEVMGYINSDDILLPGGLWRIAEAFKNSPKLDVIYHDIAILTNNWMTSSAPQPLGVCAFDFLFSNHILFQEGTWWRRRCYEEVGGFDQSFKLAGDFDLWLRMSLKFKFTKQKGHVSAFRKRKGQLSENKDSYAEELLRSQRTVRKELSLKTYVKQSFIYVRRKIDRLILLIKSRKLHYPLNPGFELPAVRISSPKMDTPRCLLTNRPPDWLMFTSPDTQFGTQWGDRLWRFDDSDTVLIEHQHPEEDLRERLSSSKPLGRDLVSVPEESDIPPYRYYRGRGILRVFSRRLQMPKAFSSFINGKSALDPICATQFQLLAMLHGEIDPQDEGIDFLDVGCGSGDLLGQLKKQTAWKLFGVEEDLNQSKLAAQKAHHVYECSPEALLQEIPVQQKFDVIFLGHILERLSNPYQVLRRLKSLLKPNGRCVILTPNIDSAQVDVFGPCWTHWNPMLHQVLFGRRGLRLLGEKSGYRLVKMRSVSRPKWTILSQKLVSLGLGSAVHSKYCGGEHELRRAASLTAWQVLLSHWNRRGDCLLAVFSLE